MNTTTTTKSEAINDWLNKAAALAEALTQASNAAADVKACRTIAIEAYPELHMPTLGTWPDLTGKRIEKLSDTLADIQDWQIDLGDGITRVRALADLPQFNAKAGEYLEVPTAQVKGLLNAAAAEVTAPTTI